MSVDLDGEVIQVSLEGEISQISLGGEVVFGSELVGETEEFLPITFSLDFSEESNSMYVAVI